MSSKSKKTLIKIASFIIMFLVVCPFIGILSTSGLDLEQNRQLIGSIGIIVVFISGPGSHALLKKIFISEEETDSP